MNYEDMSDLQINELVANRKGFSTHISAEFVMIYLGFEDGAQVYSAIDYCNNPSDAWPIIFDNKIDIYFGIQCADGAHKSGIDIEDKNPLRAAMIVFLQMNEDK